MNNVIRLEGLDCAECARELGEELEKIEGVQSANVDFMAQKVYIDCTAEALEKAVYSCNHFEDVKVVSATEKNSAENAAGGCSYSRKLKIKNLCCANCGRELEEDLNKVEGVTATVDFMNMQVILDAADKAAYDRAVYIISHFEDVEIVDTSSPKKSVWREHISEIIRIAASAVLLVLAIIFDKALTGRGFEIASYVLYAAAYLTVGYDVLIMTAKNIIKGKIFDENFLMTVASIGAVALGIVSGDGFFEGVAVMLLYQIGELFQAIAVGSSRRSITELMNLKSEEAVIIDGESLRTVNPEDLKIGDVILIKAGDKVPADGVIVKGSSALDMKSLNGEPVPREVSEGDEILSGSINLSGVLEVKVIREYKNSAVARILEMVENSTAKKAPPEKFITKFAKYYTPLVCLAAAIVAGIVPTIICAVNGAYVWATYSDWIYKALNFLVISCPCALVISVPLSYFGGIGRCADFGILVKGGTDLDELALATVAAFDKTGTLTEGTFAVTQSSSERALALAASAEKFSSHPIAAAFKDIGADYAVENCEEIAGRGVKCTTDGKVLLCGNAKLLRENNVKFEEVSSPSTLVYVALNGEYVGVIYIDDKPKAGAKDALSALKEVGVKKSVMLTGDSRERAEAIAATLGLDGCRAALLPDEKLAEAEKLKQEGKLIYVGDGINDAPVMVAADCAVSMGKMGSDAAIEASDIVLLTDNLSLLAKAKRIAVGTRRIVFENIIGSLAIKLLIMVLSVAVPSFPLIGGIIGDVGVMIVAVLNAMRIKIMFKK